MQLHARISNFCRSYNKGYILGYDIMRYIHSSVSIPADSFPRDCHEGIASIPATSVPWLASSTHPLTCTHERMLSTGWGEQVHCVYSLPTPSHARMSVCSRLGGESRYSVCTPGTWDGHAN